MWQLICIAQFSPDCSLRLQEQRSSTVLTFGIKWMIFANNSASVLSLMSYLISKSQHYNMSPLRKKKFFLVFANSYRLTVIEHLVFYANLKMGNQISMAEIDQVIEDLGLSHKRNEMSCHLSGGMKRKLSIGAAFIGNSRYELSSVTFSM